jgi:hypothetical protein
LLETEKTCYSQHNRAGGSMRIPGDTAIPGLPRAQGRRAALLRAAFRTILPLVTVFFGLSAFVRADDFWKQKPPAQWSHAEALKLVRHSPWAKVEAVVFHWRENQASYSISTGKRHCDPDTIDANGNCMQKMKVEPPLILPSSRMGRRGFRPRPHFLCAGNRRPR